MWWLVLPLIVGALQHVSEPDAFQLAVKPPFATSPGVFRAEVIVEPNPDNRWLVLRADSDQYYRSSTMELHGAAAPRRHMMLFEHLPAGKYRIEAILKRSNGDEFIRDVSVQVNGMGR